MLLSFGHTQKSENHRKKPQNAGMNSKRCISYVS